MKKKEDLINNPYHDQEDEYRDPMAGRSPLWLVIIILLIIGAFIYGLHLLTIYIRAL